MNDGEDRDNQKLIERLLIEKEKQLRERERHLIERQLLLDQGIVHMDMDMSTTVASIGAFPPLGEKTFHSTSTSSDCTKSIYGIEPKVKPGTFGILNDFKGIRLPRSQSILWFEAARQTFTLKPWSGEVNIQTYVENALSDCQMLSPLFGSLNVYREGTVSFAQLMGNRKGNRADATIHIKNKSSIISFAKVKVPGSNLDDIYQIVDYMIDLRNHYNVHFVFGVYTTYEEWKILWFEDTNAAAECTSKDEYDEMCLGGSANEYAIEKGTINVYQSKLYKFDDPELIECLATLLYKVSKTPIYTPTGFIDDCSRYLYATPTSIEYKLLPKTVEKFKYAMPPNNTFNFYILSHFQRGGDGHVALVTSETGHLSVVKFLHISGTDEKEALEDEQNHWKTLWQVDCRIIVLNGRSGLLMPFCLSFNSKKSSKFPFSSLKTWNKISSMNSYDMISDEMEDCVNLEQLQKYQNFPLLAAEQALFAVSEKLSCHLDICFRHVALLPRWNSLEQIFDFQPILIDLTRLESDLNPTVAQSHAEESLAKLMEEWDQMQLNSS